MQNFKSLHSRIFCYHPLCTALTAEEWATRQGPGPQPGSSEEITHQHQHQTQSLIITTTIQTTPELISHNSLFCCYFQYLLSNSILSSFHFFVFCLVKRLFDLTMITFFNLKVFSSAN